MEKHDEMLKKAAVSLKTADHMVYITYPLLKENRLLKKILENIYSSALSTVNAILQYEYTQKRIEPYRFNLETFKHVFRECAKRYNVTREELEIIEKVLFLMQKHKESPFEFIRKDKFVMMSDSLRIETVTIDQLKNYISTTKSILEKARNTITKEKEERKRFYGFK